jgi:hypothetical protein
MQAKQVRRMKQWPSWQAVLLLSLALEIVAIGATLVLAGYWGLPSADELALGQLIVALLLIPLAVVAFWEAREAIATAAPRPRTRMAFLGEDGFLHDQDTMRLPPDSTDANRISLALENFGDTVAVWWQASFEVPTSLAYRLRLGQGSLAVLPRQAPLTMDTVGLAVERYVAQSAGTVALFPGPPVQIAVKQGLLDPNFLSNLRSGYLLRYEVLSDKSQLEEGYLSLGVEVLP